MPDRGPDRQDIRDVGTRPHPDEKPTDVGRTMGGGSLGHAPAEDVEAQGELRNNPPAASPDAERLRRNHGNRGSSKEGAATGSEDDPAIPADDATLKTKI